MGERRNVGVPEGRDAMTHGGRVTLLMSLVGVLERLPRMLRSGQVILFSLLFGGTMGVRGRVV